MTRNRLKQRRIARKNDRRRAHLKLKALRLEALEHREPLTGAHHADADASSSAVHMPVDATLASTSDPLGFSTHAAAASKLLSYFDGLAAMGLKVPASPQRPNRPSLKAVAADAGIAMWLIAGQKCPLRFIVDMKVAELGLELPLPAPADMDATVFPLSVIRESHLAVAKQTHQAQGLFYRERHDSILEFYRLVEANAAATTLDATTAKDGEPALAHFRGLIATGKVRNGVLHANLLDEAERIVAQLKANPPLPDAFHERLSLLIARSGLSLSAVARHIGVGAEALNKWRSGERAPTRSNLPLVSNLETLLKVEPGILTDRWTTNRVGRGRLPAVDCPPELQGKDTARLRSKISAILPEGFVLLSRAEKHAAIRAAAERIKSETAKKARWNKLRQDHYHLAFENWPDHLRDQFEKLRAYKEGGAHVTGADNLARATRSKWRPSTSEIWKRRFGLFFGYLMVRPDNPVPVEDLELAMLFSRDAQKGFIDFKLKRKQDAASHYRITPTDTDYITTAASLLAPLDGFFQYSPSLWPTVEAASKHVEFPERLGGGRWTRLDTAEQAESFCRRCHDDLKQLESGYRGHTEMSESHQQRLLPLLLLPKPLDTVYAALERLAGTIETIGPRHRSWHREIRLCFVGHLVAQMGLRVETLCALDYDPANISGDMRFENGKWVVYLPKHKVKNGDVARLFRNEPVVRRELIDERGAYAAFEAYLNGSRQALLEHAVDDALIVGTPENPRFSSARMQQLGYHLSARLFGSKAGKHRIENLGDFGFHAFRDILATSIIKTTKKASLAADALIDTEKSVLKHYGVWLTSDRSDELADALRAAAGAPGARSD